MMRRGTSLVSDDGSIDIPWTSEAIAVALRERQIIPGMLCVFCTISFYYGVKCLGGYSQVNYLTYMKRAFMAMLTQLGEPDAADTCDLVATKNWSGFSFSYIEDDRGSILPAQFLDLYLHMDHGMFQRLMDYAHVCTIGQAVEPILPEIYRYSYAEKERDPSLLSVTPEELTKLSGLRSCLRCAR